MITDAARGILDVAAMRPFVLITLYRDKGTNYSDPTIEMSNCVDYSDGRERYGSVQHLIDVEAESIVADEYFCPHGDGIYRHIWWMRWTEAYDPPGYDIEEVEIVSFEPWCAIHTKTIARLCYQCGKQMTWLPCCECNDEDDGTWFCTKCGLMEDDNA